MTFFYCFDFLFIFAVFLAIVIVDFSFLGGASNPGVEKGSAYAYPYQRGFAPYEDARNVSTVRFYLIVTLFVIFDLEAVYFFPWSASNASNEFLNADGFWVMLDLIAELIGNYFFSMVSLWTHQEVVTLTSFVAITQDSLLAESPANWSCNYMLGNAVGQLAFTSIILTSLTGGSAAVAGAIVLVFGAFWHEGVSVSPEQTGSSIVSDARPLVETIVDSVGPINPLPRTWLEYAATYVDAAAFSPEFSQAVCVTCFVASIGCFFIIQANPGMIVWVLGSLSGEDKEPTDGDETSSESSSIGLDTGSVSETSEEILAWSYNFQEAVTATKEAIADFREALQCVVNELPAAGLRNATEAQVIGAATRDIERAEAQLEHLTSLTVAPSSIKADLWMLETQVRNMKSDLYEIVDYLGSTPAPEAALNATSAVHDSVLSYPEFFAYLLNSCGGSPSGCFILALFAICFFLVLKKDKKC